MSVVDVDAIHAARQFVRTELARAHKDALAETYRAHSTGEPYTNDKASIARRRIANSALSYLSMLGDEELDALVATQFEGADNMTDRQVALFLLSERDTPARTKALEAFYEEFKSDPLVLDKWFSVQAFSSQAGTLAAVQALTKHADFTLKNPNRTRALVGAFCAGNQVRFHAEDGEGYAFLADVVLELDGLNPQVASRLVSAFNQYRHFDEGRQQLMRAQLERIAAKEGLSKDVGEIVGRALNA
jgi:aminopeptidase N